MATFILNAADGSSNSIASLTIDHNINGTGGTRFTVGGRVFEIPQTPELDALLRHLLVGPNGYATAAPFVDSNYRA